ncbi:glycosyltransferase family 4 protein [Vibrio cholerae]|uniref:glycosyltransferase family 4 protein n=1 Tax=Vibrio cholerae TaxID=666 RepID=UPI0002734848|nr:glycosyltransferase family 4 protein [Vibrio cholerae]EGQ8316077.1 glycosyltransferase [Vibrio cholerae]EGR2831724.1 glycosyltransferase [Vibrio cholerae]EGR4429390.1 glycosyltransferase [Vibrio cholerae]EJH65826.1 glycosyl transferases group 1 family protein [Vibrio cholerae HE-25]EJL6315010.1 glycosyltransferase family 4 protein [Vibrio cholerae]
MAVAFFHDHTFIKVGENYYSPGKLDYSKMQLYIDLFGAVNIVARYQEKMQVPNGYLIANGENVNVIGMPNLSTPKGVLARFHAKKTINEIVSNHQYIIARLPSEYGILSLNVAKNLNKTVLVEVVADAFDCLYYQKSILKKIYAFILDARVRKVIKSCQYISYVTNKYLQLKYPASKNAYSIGISDVNIQSVRCVNKHLHNNIYKIIVIANPDLQIKSVDTVVRAADSLARKGYNIKLDVLGGTGQEYIRCHGDLPRNVEFHASVSSEEVINYLDNSDIYVQPSLTEGMPRALLEAMSRGLPCCTTPAGGMIDIVHQECIFPKKDVSSLERILLKLINDKFFYDKICKHSIDTILESFYSNDTKSKRVYFYKMYRDSVI